MSRQTIALCMITQDSQSTIGMTIKSALVLVDIIIIIDLNSNDDTRIVAEGYGAQVIQCNFNGDYSKVKNLALDKATCDWILWLNPNETIGSLKPIDFQNLLKTNAIGYNINIISEDSTSSTQELRLFRNHSEVRYQYPARERIEPSLRKWQSTTNFDDVGLTNVLKIICDTKRFNPLSIPKNIINILNKSLEHYPNDPYLEYALACEYINESEGQVIPNNNLHIAINKLKEAKRKSFTLNNDERDELNYLSDILLKLSACYLASGRNKLAWHDIKAAKEFYPENHAILLQYIASGINYLCNIVKDNRGTEAQKLQRELIDLINLLKQLNVNQAQLIRHRGNLALFMGDVGKAQAYFKLVLDINDNSSYALLGLAQCQVYLGNKTGAIKFYMAATEKNKHNYLAWLEGSRLLKEIGFIDNANSWRNKVSDGFPYLLKSETNN